MKGISFVLFMLGIMTAVNAATLCSFGGPETSDDMLRLSNFTVTGPSSLEEGDSITVKFTLQSYGQNTITFGPKGIFAGAKDPDSTDASFGKDYDGSALRPGSYASVSFTTTLDKAGTWVVWPSYQILSGKTYGLGPSEWHACSLKVAAVELDSDQDRIPDNVDNCPETYNPSQRDIDDDGKGDECDSCDDRDSDKDGVKNCLDECPEVQGLADRNGCPAPEAKDTDADGIEDDYDNCVSASNQDQKDIDNDGKGDACDSCDDRDADNDGIKNCYDKCPSQSGTQNNSGCPAVTPLTALTMFAMPEIGGGPATLTVPSMKNVVEGPLFPDAVQDGDNDSVINIMDDCPNTPADALVYENGCRCKDSEPGWDKYYKGTVEYSEKVPHIDIGGMGSGNKNETGFGYSITNYFSEDSCSYMGSTSFVEEKYCNPAYETGASDEPFSMLTFSCTLGCSGGKCRRPFICASSGGGTCSDGIQNQDETGIDCNGKCPPCNTHCTSGTKYAPADTPCTTYYNTDMHRVNYTWTDSDLEYACRWYEVCHPDLDFVIAEAAECCSATTDAEIAAMPDPALCKDAIESGSSNCRKCTGMYIIKGLGQYARWMEGYQELDTLYTSPTPTAEHLINDYKIGVCRDYSLATATLLRKDGYPQNDIGNYCDGAHCYNVIRFPGDAKWHIVDTTGNDFDVTLGGLPGSGYPYCKNLNESRWCYFVDKPGFGDDYHTYAIPDVDAYWSTVGGGGTYNYTHATICYNTMNFLPMSGPGLAVGRDNYRIPDFAPSVNNLVGCN